MHGTITAGKASSTKLLKRDISGFVSTFEERGQVILPKFSGTRVMMLPIVLGDVSSVPDTLSHYKEVIQQLFSMQSYDGQVGYMTIDEKVVSPGQSHRRAGVHVDGVYARESSGPEGAPEEVEGGVWAGGGWAGGSSGQAQLTAGIVTNFGTGMLTVSNPAGCRAWNKVLLGFPKAQGECGHLSDQLSDAEAVLFKENTVYWANPLCVHESLVVKKPTQRQFVRLSLPSDAPWFEGYTENPLGIKPTGPVLARREYLDLP